MISRKLKSFVKRSSVFRIPLMAYRARISLSHVAGSSLNAFQWLLSSKEHTNFTYEISELNREYLVHFIALATSRKFSEVEGYFSELESNRPLFEHIRKSVRTGPYQNVADPEARFARRLGWYALARILKPKVIVETGIDKGLGSCVLCLALMKNTEEGSPGTYYGTDINPGAGYLFQAPYNRYGRILYGDSIASLEKFDQKIDLFINDSDHSDEYEAREYETIWPKLSDQAYIVGDNSDCTNRLSRFALSKDMNFIYFQERPKNHWYSGGGIGLAWRRNR